MCWNPYKELERQGDKKVDISSLHYYGHSNTKILLIYSIYICQNLFTTRFSFCKPLVKIERSSMDNDNRGSPFGTQFGVIGIKTYKI